MTLLLSLADSEVRRVVVANDTRLRVEFSAAAVHRLGAAGRVEHGWLPGVSLLLDAARLTTDDAAFGRLTEGRLRVDGRDFARLPLPTELVGDVALSLRFANGATLAARGAVLHLQLADDARFTEDLSC